MADTLTKEKRSWNMSRIRDKDTKPEIMVRKVLHGLGYRFRLHNSNLPGKPDIVLKKHRVVIFVHGCFWHRHKNCQYAYNPKSRIEFWQKKFDSNVKRDREVTKQLTDSEWRQLVIWECETKSPHYLMHLLMDFFSNEK